MKGRYMKGELGKGLGSYYRGRNLAGKEGTGQAGLERKGRGATIGTGDRHMGKGVMTGWI